MEKIIVDAENIGKRLDVFLQEKLGFSRSHIKTMIDENLVFLNGKNVKAGEKLKKNSIIEYQIKIPEKTLKIK